MKLRPYQLDCVDLVFKAWQEFNSTLIVEPTGCGKTTIFTEIARQMQPKRVLVLVHREELLNQAKDRLWEQAGIHCDIEMGALRANQGYFNKAPGVIATVQSMYSGNGGLGRMAHFKPNDFGLLICDEAHHYVSPAYRKVIDYFRNNHALKVLGVTATPDRADEAALGQIFESVAHDYEILDAIHDGWLVPVDQQMVEVEGLDFSSMRTTAGDLNGADLAEIMEREQVLQGVASASMQIIGDRRTLAFTSSVKHAEMLSNIFNRHKPNSSDWICGKTPRDVRAYKLKAFKSGEVQIMVNCGVLTEGFDCPEVECIIQARPTKSRCLYAQIIGRSLRPLPGLVDPFELPDERKNAIAGSEKKSALIIDFVGNAGRHKLMSSADILGGNVSQEAVDNAVKSAKQAGGAVRMNELLDDEQAKIERAAAAELKRQEEIAARAKLVAKSQFTTIVVNAFEKYDITPKKANPWDERFPLSPKQIDVLKRDGVDINGMSMTHKKQLFQKIIKTASEPQKKVLRRAGYDVSTIDRSGASKIIDALAKNGWSKAAADEYLKGQSNDLI